MKPYRKISINECGEPLVPIPRDLFAFYDTHPYVALGAPYGEASPWMVRQTVLQDLEKAQKELEKQRQGWKILLFDVYRPNSVQAFMVEREFATQALAVGLDPTRLTPEDRENLGQKVFRVWGIPSEDPATPPPHSTGAVLDCTLMDECGQEVDMGSPLDENSDRSNPAYFASAEDEAGQQAHKNRVLLNSIMQAQGFRRHKAEWWHFSKGDQYAAWIECEEGTNPQATAIYGRASLLKS